MLRKATKKPVTIDWVTYEEFRDGTPIPIKYIDFIKEFRYLEGCIMIPTLEGFQEFTSEDVLIFGIEGEPYPCKKRIFKKTYDFEGDL